MKICNRCKVPKEDDDFRVRISKDKKYSFLNNTCKQCDNELAHIYYNKHKDEVAFKNKNSERVRRYAQSNVENIKLRHKTSEYLKKHNQWAKKWYYKMKDVINAKAKTKRETPEYKAYVVAYRERRKDRIYKQEVVSKKRYHEKNRDAITDRYAINLLRTQGYGTVEEIENNPELIEIKRSEILLSRIKTVKLKKKNEFSRSG